MRRWRELTTDERGATAVEYGLILALLVIAAIAGYSRLSDAVIALWTYISTQVVTATGG